ncbi:Rrf2 family transcriptional regulator [Limnohabitans sp. MMS-10A-160]|uniref:RrF2 family transcriptional regulator n=1 Tax=unclassified Limnohabitans TaxID=2626134 RepID=UPI000D350C27|nr:MULTISPECIES: Rrf2 family transcriptional regulator [unclassified Limnohabitans]PUE14576.1 Rrf2 family transcriptional regulator [Limnohabitans sp. MMS-10A-192]PUE24179.1 Rrf2 family transcriptional regulator [Limnohabitans sp. MMS-10A-160]
MRLTHWTDYSLRVLMYCAQCEAQQSVATIQAIADQHGISKSHLTKIVMTLAADGYLQTSRGRGGGICLGRPAAQIVLGEVVRKTETDFQMVECFGEGQSHCALLPACHLKNVLAQALEAFFATLDGITLADLMDTTQARMATLQTLAFKPQAARSRKVVMT